MEPKHGHRRPIVVQEDLRANLVDERVADRVLDVQGPTPHTVVTLNTQFGALG